jgi:predicted nucleic acid-binding protein
MNLFLDTSALIYLLEGFEPHSSQVRNILNRMQNFEPKLHTNISRITMLECRVKPIREQDRKKLTLYEKFFGHKDVNCIDLSQQVIELATVIRAYDGLKVADAIQAASCLQLGEDHVFVSGDKGFKRVKGLNVITVA